ncbi:hypothetical protein K438DRAFT_1985649 [Mycena galopus ATCC 62051]|nr:hypothetical protein K438DRAFT_1985649 [Mycena galopus ATCC 62051]
MAQATTDSHFYAARVASLTSAGAVRLEWYVDNIYTQHEQPLESEFLYTKEACAKAAAANADLTYFKDNVGAIRWPYRLLEDAHDVHEYNNIQIAESLLHSRHAVIEILSGLAPHPIVHDYETWMSSAGQLTQENHANDFARKFFEARILPGDASLIEPHTEHVVQQICFPLSGENMDLRRRVIVLAPLLFQLVILRIYLRRSPADDEQIYFLTRIFDKSELKKINNNDPLLGAKRGKVIRNKTVPEIVMNTPETSSSTNEIIPYRWCKMGIRISKAAAPCIPPKFVLANAFDALGGDYIWSPSDTCGIFVQLTAPSIKSPFSSPLSALPPEMDVEPAPEESRPVNHDGRKGKRKRAVDDVGERQTIDAAVTEPLAVKRRSARGKGGK